MRYTTCVKVVKIVNLKGALDEFSSAHTIIAISQNQLLTYKTPTTECEANIHNRRMSS